MCRIVGILKVLAVLTLNVFIVYALLENVGIALLTAGVMLLYVLFGGYLTLLKEQAVNSKHLPSAMRIRLEDAKAQLVAEVNAKSKIKLRRLPLYLVPEDHATNATAYGFHCISVTRGTFDSVDSTTLRAVLAHEISHILNFDAEFQRAVFCTVTILVVALSVASFAATITFFLLFLLLRCFRSWIGTAIFYEIKRFIREFFRFVKRGAMWLYRAALGLVSRHAEYRCDKFSFTLGYGVPLSQFLELTEPSMTSPSSLSESVFRTHPPVIKRIARLENLLLTRNAATTSYTAHP